MKTLKFLIVLVFAVGVFNSNSSFAQASKTTNYDVDIYLTRPINVDGVECRDTIYTLNSGIENIVISSVGNYLRIVTFKIDENNDIMELANPIAFFKVTIRIDINGDGEDEVLTDKFSVLTKTGNLKLVYHDNGK